MASRIKLGATMYDSKHDRIGEVVSITNVYVLCRDVAGRWRTQRTYLRRQAKRNLPSKGT